MISLRVQRCEWNACEKLLKYLLNNYKIKQKSPQLKMMNFQQSFSHLIFLKVQSVGNRFFNWLTLMLHWHCFHVLLVLNLNLCILQRAGTEIFEVMVGLLQGNKCCSKSQSWKKQRSFINLYFILWAHRTISNN